MNRATSASRAPISRHGVGEVAPPEHQVADPDRDGGQRRGRDRGRHREGAVPGGGDLPDEPEGEQADGEHERRDAAHGIRPEQCAQAPHADEDRLVGGHLQALGRLEHDGAEGRGRQQAQGTDDRGCRVAQSSSPCSQQLGRDHQAEPDGDHQQEAREGRHVVEVGGDQPDQPQADEAGTEGEHDPRQREPAAGDVATADGLRAVGVDQPLGLPVGQLALEPVQLGGGGGVQRLVAVTRSGGGGGGGRGHRGLLGVGQVTRRVHPHGAPRAPAAP